MKRLLGTVAILFVLFCTMNANAENINFSLFRNGQTMYQESLQNIMVQYLEEAPLLYEPNISIAIGGNNHIAVWSGPALSSSFETVVSVYSENGEFLYGYEIKEKAKNGLKFIVLIDDVLYLYHSWYNTLFEFDSGGAGIVNTYTISDNEIKPLLGDYIRNWGTRFIVSIDPDAKYQLAQYNKGRLAIKNENDHVITIYDNSNHYKKLANRHIQNIIVWACFNIIGIIILIITRRSKKRNKLRTHLR